MRKFLIVCVLLLALLIYIPVVAQAAIVRAVLFYSPSCPHCQKVMTEDLPPLLEKYKDRLQIIGINVSVQEGQDLYQSAIKRFDIQDDRLGVPCLVVGDTVLVGSAEIPEKFPGIIETILATGGIDWPEIPGLDALLPEDETANPVLENFGQTTLSQRFLRDPVGNSLAVIVLAVLAISAVWSTACVVKSTEQKILRLPDWSTPVLAGIGLGVALYLSYIEMTQTEAICGPVGDCNAVQHSPYAILFGVLPVGVFGVIGFTMILIAWIINRYSSESMQQISSLLLWGMALFGVLFGSYLTFLEPFVIGATCMWCLTVALLMIIILWRTTNPAIAARKEVQ